MLKSADGKYTDRACGETWFRGYGHPEGVVKQERLRARHRPRHAPGSGRVRSRRSYEATRISQMKWAPGKG